MSTANGQEDAKSAAGQALNALLAIKESNKTLNEYFSKTDFKIDDTLKILIENVLADLQKTTIKALGLPVHSQSKELPALLETVEASAFEGRSRTKITQYVILKIVAENSDGTNINSLANNLQQKGLYEANKQQRASLITRLNRMREGKEIQWERDTKRDIVIKITVEGKAYITKLESGNILDEKQKKFLKQFWPKIFN
jgi:hypothetical protein